MAEVLVEALDELMDLAVLEGLLDRVADDLSPDRAQAARADFADLARSLEPPLLALGAALFAEPPGGFAQRFATYWDLSRAGLLDPVAEAPQPRAIAAL